MKPIFWTPERVRRMREIAESGEPARRAAQEFGVTTSAVEWQASKHRIRFSGHAKMWTDWEDRTLERMARRGSGWKEIAYVLKGRSRESVASRARKLGVKFVGKGAKKVVDYMPVQDVTLPPRKCLMHGGTFTPSHKHEFVCPPCKQTKTWKESQVQLI